MRRFARILGFATLLALAPAAITLSSAPAHAQTGRLTTGGMDLHLFRPAVDSKGLLSTAMFVS